MGSIEPYETAKGRRYRVRYRKPDHSQGAKRGFSTKREAEQWMRQVETSKDRGEFIDVAETRATIGSLGAAWLTTQTHLKPSSLRPVEIAWRIHVEPQWGSVPVGQVRHSDVQAWVTRLSAGRSATTVQRAHQVLAAILDVAVRDRRVLTNAARSVNLPRKVRKEHRYLTHEQTHLLADNAGRHRALVLTLAYTGLRWGEATGLRVRDVDMLKRRLNVTQNAVEVGSENIVGTPKTHKRRSVPFPAFLTEDLAAALEGKTRDELVFATSVGTHLRRVRTDGEKQSWFRSALEKSGLEPMTPHDLRHTAASLAISAGANVKAVQRMLGHSSAAMTLDVYADLFDDDLDAVSAALDQAVTNSGVSKVRPIAALATGTRSSSTA